MADDLTSAYFSGNPDIALSTLSRRFWDIESQAEQRAGALRAAASSAGMETIQQRLVVCRHAARDGGDSLHSGAGMAKEASRAFMAFHRSTPTPDEIASARGDHRGAVEAVRQAALADRPTAALCEIRDAAKRHLDDLVYRREAAIAELERCLTRVLERSPRRPGRDIDTPGGGRTIPGTPLPTPPHGEKMPMPMTPGTPGLPPRTAPPSTPPTTISSTPGSTDALAQLLSAAARPAAVQPTMPMQQPPMQMPQMPPVPPQPAQAAAPASRDRKRGPIDEAIDDLLGDEDRDTAAPGLAAAAVTPAPRPAPAGSIAPAAPAVPPVSGTSADNLTTNAPTSGRPGATPAGAFAPPTSLSGSHIASQQMAGSSPATAAGAHPGTGAPMTGPMGMPGAGAGGGSGSGRPPIERHSGRDHGRESLDEAVPYTIARKPRD